MKRSSSLNRRRQAGAWPKKLRMDAGLTQSGFADRPGFPYYAFVSQVETGRVRGAPCELGQERTESSRPNSPSACFRFMNRNCTGYCTSGRCGAINPAELPLECHKGRCGRSSPIVWEIIRPSDARSVAAATRCAIAARDSIHPLGPTPAIRRVSLRPLPHALEPLRRERRLRRLVCVARGSWAPPLLDRRWHFGGCEGSFASAKLGITVSARREQLNHDAGETDPQWRR